MVARSVLRGSTRRMRPMAFSMPPFLPGGIRIAEEGLQIKRLAQVEMAGELGAVVEGDGPGSGGGNGPIIRVMRVAIEACGFSRRHGRQQQPRTALVDGEDGLDGIWRTA